MQSIDDLLAPDVIANPYPLYERLREHHPIHWNERWKGWVVSRFDDVERLVRNPKLLADSITPYFETRLTPEQQERYRSAFAVLTTWIVFDDPPTHTRLRKLLSKAFTPRRVAEMRPQVQELVDDLLDRCADRGTMDLVEDLAYPLPAHVMSRMLGAPDDDMGLFRRWSDDITVFVHGGMADDGMERTQRAMDDFADYVTAMVAERRVRPRDDLVTALLQARESTDSMSEDELLASCMLLLTAGHETTQNLIASGLFRLLSDQEQLARLKVDLTLVPSAVEEMLRYDSPARATVRFVGDDFEYEGVTFAKGQRVQLLWSSANHDPQHFPNSDKLDITRKQNDHFAFGKGIHFCIGAPLARLEGQIAVESFLRRFPDARLLDTELRFHRRMLTGSVEGPITVELGASA